MDEKKAGAISNVLAYRDPWLRLGYTENGLFGYLTRKDPSLNRYAVTVFEETAGVVCIRYPWLLGPYIEMLAVFPPYQCKGLGKALIFWICGACCGLPKNIWTTASSFNTQALSFYKNIGFSEIAELPDLVADGFSEVLLQKKCR